MDDKMRKKLLELRELVWDEDIPSPVCPEYIEHHESIQKILNFIDNELLREENEMNIKELNNGWISIKDNLPNDKQQVLTYYYDKPYDLHQIDMLTYYKKGTLMGIKTDKNKTHMLKERLYNFLYNKDYEIVAKEDGFYISEWDEEGDICFRRHSDCITHWHPLPEPPNDQSI